MLCVMALRDSILNAEDVARARDLLTRPAPRDRLWPALAAAGALACTALAFATVMIIAPPVKTDHVAAGAPD
jgi:predicted lysophospholipase L1 biosynthesis ABC-type transport system permease subunit